MVIGPSATTRPAARTAIRLQTLCRLSRSWAIMKTVNPKVHCRVRIRSSKALAPIGSSPDVGSSRKTISGSSGQRTKRTLKRL